MGSLIFVCEGVLRLIKQSSISLVYLQGIYEKDILPYSFCYELEDGTMLSLFFEEAQFSHLLAIQKVDFKRKDLQGQKCYDEIKSGRLTYQKLKSINKTALKTQCKDKMRYFDELPILLRNPECIEYDESSTGRKTNIKISFALHKTYGNLGKKLIIGIDSSSDRFDYYPRTWLIENITKSSSLLMGQNVRKIISVQINRR